jgi:hypothetical protein
MRNVLYAGDHRHLPPVRVSRQSAIETCCNDSVRPLFYSPDQKAVAIILQPLQRYFTRRSEGLPEGRGGSGRVSSLSSASAIRADAGASAAVTSNDRPWPSSRA